MDERGPALPRHGEQEEAHNYGRRELGDNSTHTGVTFDLNPSQLPGVAPSPGVSRRPIEAAQDNLRNSGRRQHPRTSNVSVIEGYTLMHCILHVGNLTFALQRSASPVDPPTGRLGWTSEGQLCRRKRTIVEQHNPQWGHLNLSKLPGVASTRLC